MSINSLINNDKNRIFIVAEISANHGNDIEIAKKTILSIKESGADAVKIQTYTPDTLTIKCDNEYFKLNNGTLWDGMTLYDLYSKAYMPWEWHAELYNYAKSLGILLFSTPFDNTAVDLLEELNNPIYKIASFEINHIPLIKYAASKNKPMILSTGIATKDEISAAIEACYSVGNKDITLLKCTSEYPAKIEDANLSMIKELANRFNVKVGVSDHTMGSFIPTISAAMGIHVIEKHFIMDRSIGGPDSAFSMTPSEFREMVDNVRLVEKALGTVNYDLTEKKQNSRKFARSIFCVQNIKKGDIITMHNISVIRPGDGLHPKYYEDILGKKVNQDILKGYPMSLDKIE